MSRPSTTARDEILTETRRRLLEAAAEEFARKGFTAANINHISTAAGYAKGTIYNYFSSKRSLMLALIDEIADFHTNFIVSRVVSEPDPIQRLTRFFSAGYEFFDQHPAISQVAISIIYGHDKELKERMFQTYEGLFNLIIKDIVETGVTRGHFRPVDPNKTAALLMSLYLGSCSLLDPDGKVWFKPDQVVAFVLAGLQQSCDHDANEA